jgi:amidase
VYPNLVEGVRQESAGSYLIDQTLLDCPVIGMPVGLNAEGLPMGMQIIGINHADFAVLQIAYAYEQATHWVRKQLPPQLKAKPQVD